MNQDDSKRSIFDSIYTLDSNPAKARQDEATVVQRDPRATRQVAASVPDPFIASQF